MRGGPFSETRVIELLNRRFVPFYYNTGGPGLGKDEAAAAFARPKTPNPWAFFAAYAPDGSVLGVTEIYAGTDDVFEFLRALLRRRILSTDRETTDESALLARAGKGGDATTSLAAGRLHEGFARYGEARAAYAKALERGDGADRVAAYRGLFRITRYDRDWPAHQQYLTAARGSPLANELAVDLVLEESYRLMAQKRWASARALLQPWTRTTQSSSRLAELHYEAGRACWFMDDRDWAKLHWCWIIEHLPDDRFYMRASLAAAADVFPYPNHELGGFKAKVGPVGPGVIGSGIAAATKVYRRLLPSFEAGDFGQGKDAASPASGGAEAGAGEMPAEPRPATAALDQPESVVARLRDDAEAGARSRGLELLIAQGEAAVFSLIVAARNPAFGGRGQAVHALARILAEASSLAPATKKAAVDTLRGLTKDRDRSVADAARAGLELPPADAEGKKTQGGEPESKPSPRGDAEVKQSPRGDAEKSPASALPKSPLLLVAALRDGNDHRVANNRVVDALRELGEPALAPLRAALEDREFPGRGYAAFALGSVLKKVGKRPPEILQLLADAAEDPDPYVRALAKSARTLLD